MSDLTQPIPSAFHAPSADISIANTATVPRERPLTLVELRQTRSARDAVALFLDQISDMSRDLEILTTRCNETSREFQLLMEKIHLLRQRKHTIKQDLNKNLAMIDREIATHASFDNVHHYTHAHFGPPGPV
jgi:chromosome segregation ATPase